jgi:predicted CxxxxCH...CXXCH cytochrome family protein
MAEPRKKAAPAGQGATFSLALAVLAAALAALSAPGCLERHEPPEVDPAVARCTGCHGDAERAGDYLGRSAPPFDLLRQTTSDYPGVGAHAIHLDAGPTHAAIACDECHTIPERVEAPGHADTARPAELTFGPLARRGDRNPTYEASPRTCADSYCHREAAPVWSEPRASADACGSCHGLPPPAPHPQSDRCYACHGEVIDAERHFLAPERHVDGTVDYVAGDCQSCHGSAANPAPPLDTSGNQSSTALGVGAHQAHLDAKLGRSLACDECHRVPERVEEPTHADGLPAELLFTGVALSEEHDAAWDAAQATCSGSWCHGPSAGSTHASPVWNVAAELTCTTCHEAPPAAPHPQMTECSTCHAAVVDDDDHTLRNKARHIDGTVDVEIDEACNACHGDDDAAPPRDIAGNTLTSAAGVGAHQTHVLGTERSRAVACGECHVVPESVLEVGHADTERPAELLFAGVALARGALPRYENGTCSSTSCHGDVIVGYQESGGANTTPLWTRVDGSEAACGSCHAIPPPPPHPNPYPCHTCHGNMADDDVSFVRPDLHVDGIVTMALDD